MMGRRELLSGGLVLLAGCSQFRPPDEDYSQSDLRISNERAGTVAVTVTFVPEGQSEPTMELSVSVPSEDAVEWDHNSLLDDPGHVTVTVEGEAGETRRKESDWRGDTTEDNVGLAVVIREDEIEVYQLVG